MRAINSKASLMKSALAAAVLLVAATASYAQTVVGLTAAPTTAALPDGQAVPMWGYSCDGASVLAGNCRPANPNAGVNATTLVPNWSPVVITVPYTEALGVSTTGLTINLTNNLSFLSGANAVPTSLVIVGQIGGGLGGAPTRTTSPVHGPQGPTWPASGGPDTSIASCTDNHATAGAVGTNCPPAQPDRVQSFGTEVAAGNTAALTWTALRPGTYLIESGTHPSIQGPMGLYGVLVVTQAPGAGAGVAYPAVGTALPVNYASELSLVLSEIDPVQNAAVAAAVATAGFLETNVWNGQAGMCGDVPPSPTAVPGVANTCYPPAVNYTPLYYLINGVSFDASATWRSQFGTTGAATGTVLVRYVNAGLRMHVPSIVNAVTGTAPGVSLIAEDGNVLPGVPKVQNEVFLAAGKTYDVLIDDIGTGLNVYDRQLSLSTNNRRGGGMMANINRASGTVPSGTPIFAATGETYYCAAGATLTVSDPAKGVLANDPGANGAAIGVLTNIASTELSFNSNGTFSYTPASATSCGGTFTYLVNGLLPGATATITECDSSTPSCTALGGPPVATNISFMSHLNSRFTSSPPGVLAGVTDPKGLALSAVATAAINADGSFIAAGPGGPLGATTAAVCPQLTPALPAGTTCLDLQYQAKNSQGTLSNTADASVYFLPGSGLNLVVRDAKMPLPAVAGGTDTGKINDYRWIIEEDRTFYVDPKCQVNSTDPLVRPAGCPALPVQSLAYNMHSAGMPIVATGCVGAVSCENGQSFGGGTTAVACDVGNGVCRDTASQKTSVTPDQVYLDPAKRYYISVLPGDGVNPTLAGGGGPMPDASKPSGSRPFSIALDCGTYNPTSVHWIPGGPAAGYGDGDVACGHAMGGQQVSGALIAAGQNLIRINLEETPLPTAKITAFVFADDNPLNGEADAGGASVGTTGLAANEPGLGGFNLELFDQAGGLGDATGQITYDMFNQPVSNALAGTKDPITGLDACPITGRDDLTSTNMQYNFVGMIPTCPEFESDGVHESPLVGQAIVANLYPGLYEIVAHPGADRISRGEEWLQTNTLDGGPPHEAFLKADEPSYFQEFGPGNFHVVIGFANPETINARRHAVDPTTGNHVGICDAPVAGTGADLGSNVGGGGLSCTQKVFGQVTNAHMSRTPDQRTVSSGDYNNYGFTQCYVAMGPPDGADFAFTKCAADGSFEFDDVPVGDYKLSVFDQWNDIMLDGLVNPIHVAGTSGAGSSAGNPIVFPVTQWRTNLSTRTFLDTGDGTAGSAGDGVSQADEPGLPLVSTNIRYRDGSFGFFNNTDLDGYAGFNEVFPFMDWLVVETDTSRFKSTGTHVVVDTGGATDAFGGGGLANTTETNSLPAVLRVPGAVYCATADCAGASVSTGPVIGGSSGPASGLSSGRIDAPTTTEGWQGLLGQNTFIEFGMKPFAPGETGGIKGHVIYASTRPFDDPTLLLQLSWEPGVPNVKLNLYQEGTAPDGTTSLQLVDTTASSSWDDWAQGFRKGADGVTLVAGAGSTDANGLPVTSYVPNMNCPGQDPTSPFFATLQRSTMWLDTTHPISNNAQFKCFDGWAMLNQAQPAPYDGMYKFPSVTATDPTTGIATLSNCHMKTVAEPWGCIANPDTTDPFRAGTPMLPAGKYVVEVIVPTGLELVKEEDKNILLGDIYVAPVATQFAGFGNIFIMPDQAAVSTYYNKNSPGGLNMTTNFGLPHHEGDTGSIEVFWPCVGAKRQVPDYNSLYPTAGQNSPFAGAVRPLCDRKEVTLEDQHAALAKFYVFTSAHIAGHFSGTITNDFASEFDPFSPQFGEKFGPPNLPVAFRDFTGKEMGRVWSDQWGVYNGMNFSTYGVNPPNPTGYVPQMMIACMNDPGPIAKTNAAGLYVNAAGTPVPTADLAAQITDPSYNAAYSNFCYETPFMPGFTAYMDTPVIPTQAFADSYNLPDSEYPDGTPAVSSVVNTTAQGPLAALRGPWVSASGQSITIRCLGIENTTDPCSRVVVNPAFSGPAATTAPFNQKTIVRHYGFGGTAGTVAIAGVTATGCSWSNTVITCPVPSIPANLDQTTGIGSTCTSTNTTGTAGQVPPLRAAGGALQTSTAVANMRCGELVITSSTGKRSIDAITVTVAGPNPKFVNGENATENAIQLAIDAAIPGDLILVAAGTYHENVIMWKPVRLQGAGAGSVTINADAHPSGKMDPWRRQVVCLFGLAINGVPRGPSNPDFDPSGTYTCPASQYLRADRIPFEAIVGWDATGNGNLAQLLQEPTLMGAYEGAGVTVLGRGIKIPTASTDFWGMQQVGTAGAFPDGSVYLQTGSQLGSNSCARSTSDTTGRDYGTSNFQCNPSRIDGFSITNSSQGGGGIFIHGWNHFLEVSNNRVYANHGTLTGGINVGNGEVPPVFVNDGTICGAGVVVLCPPTAGLGVLPNQAIPYQFNKNIRVHHNDVYNNAGLGDALFSSTPSGAGGVTISGGADFYRLDHNWIAGNLSTGDGGGVEQLGLNVNGTMDHNFVLYNQSTNPTIPTNGGGIGIIGANGTRLLPNGNECGTVTDSDCPPAIGDGTGNVLLDSNLIVGNSAESGSGGGLRLQQVNGTEATTFPYNLTPGQWYGVTLKNNIIANNVAGWDGAGVSLEDALKVSVVNNTIVSNDTTASAGVLFKALNAPNAASPPPGCNPTTDLSTNPQDPGCLSTTAPHIPQPAGFVTEKNTPNLVDAFNGLPTLLGARVVCPSGFGYSGLAGINGNCTSLSLPQLTNDLFWQNRAFHVEITGSGTGLQSQQNLVTLLPQLNQTVTGECAAGASYWDVGVRDDTGPTNHNGGGTLTLNNSILTNQAGSVNGSNNRTPSSSPVNAQYCNGSRVPPENGGHGYLAPPGRSETTGLSTLFVFNNITPAATVDEGNNWINLTYGPLSLFNTAAQSMVASGASAVTSGAYSIGSASADARDHGANAGAPTLDYFGQTRALTSGDAADIGAVEFKSGNVSGALVSVSPSPLAFGQVAAGTVVTRDLTVANNGTAGFTGLTVAGLPSGDFARVAAPGDCGATLAAGAVCKIRVQYTAPATVGTTSTATVTVTGSTAVSGSPVAVSGTSVALVRTLSVGPTPLAFGNWASGKTSTPLVLTAVNTGNVPLSNLTFTFAGAQFTRPVATLLNPGAGGSCPTAAANSLAAGDSCTINVVFSPTAAVAYTGTLTVAAVSLSPSSVVQLTGAGVASAATVAVAPTTRLTITLPTGSSTGSGVVTLTNTAPAGGAQIGVNSVTVAGGTALTFFFAPISGGDNCTGNTLAPQATCSVQVSFTNVLSPRGANRAGTITFNLNGAASATATEALRGFATP